MEFVVNPVSHIGRSIPAIEERPFSHESIIFEVALIVDSIGIDQSAIAVFHSELHHAFEMALVFIGLYNEHALRFGIGFELIIAE